MMHVELLETGQRRLAVGTERKEHQSVYDLFKRTILALWGRTSAHLTIGKPYMPGYFPRKINIKSMVSPIPCAMIGTAKLRPVRR